MSVDNTISNSGPRSLLTRKQVAELLSVHPQTIKRWQQSNRLHAVAISRRVVRYELDAVRKLIAESQT